MSVENIVADRAIESVVHFTTNRGSLGVFASGALKSRQRLNTDAQLQHIFQPNAAYRGKDAAWLDYANLSITHINSNFFGTSSGNWHREKDFFWCILDFSPQILSHEGVWFTTTNNIYTGVQRAQGCKGLSAAFEDPVIQWVGKEIHRPVGLPLNRTTCTQAEVLYPEGVSTEYLQRIYVRTDSESDELAAQMAAVGHRRVVVEVNPDLFVEIK
ncbi:DarT ssDNA thymidine ADP-ribosyltransferase family protein [Pseudomonas sp. GM17]|uniref:DarT ssDNA thymidine ADP-ribosyltransferase family protein n=1 Tax=Pseudomonas sp. GM17 TaxID=1144323 RepID=UPI0002727758|nr:DarT ssDNA thymidine ADP-ribosyltransferase family protein [Pseudomonas sp. GM17]WIE47833.1 DarT ssDNA thymidine ADP-ribosyltransferase family protein [Pseudomonas sp. GM17]